MILAIVCELKKAASCGLRGLEVKKRLRANCARDLLHTVLASCVVHEFN
jgi:hypothetical protein